MTPDLQQQARDLLDDVKADLHPDLAPYVRPGPISEWVHHPLVVAMYSPGLAGWINKAYVQKRDALAQAADEGNLSTYVWLHERPYRASALKALEVLGLLDLDTAGAWKLVKAVWIDSENVQEEDRFWRGLWMDERARLAMSEEEAVALAKLPDPIPVWHGLERRTRFQLGYSWTTARDTAVWFARRFALLQDRPAWLAKGVAPKHAVRAYLLDRGEAEIIIAPAHVEKIHTVTLPKRKR